MEQVDCIIRSAQKRRKICKRVPHQIFCPFCANTFHRSFTACSVKSKEYSLTLMKMLFTCYRGAAKGWRASEAIILLAFQISRLMSRSSNACNSFEYHAFRAKQNRWPLLTVLGGNISEISIRLICLPAEGEVSRYNSAQSLPETDLQSCLPYVWV